MRPDITYQLSQRRPYTSAELAALYEACRTPQMRAALWELARLQDLACQLFCLVETCVQEPSKGLHAAYYQTEHLAAQEPCIRAMLADDWEYRATPYTRYYDKGRAPGAPQPRYRPPEPLRPERPASPASSSVTVGPKSGSAGGAAPASEASPPLRPST
jgi:hypothetical protein